MYRIIFVLFGISLLGWFPGWSLAEIVYDSSGLVYPVNGKPNINPPASYGGFLDLGNGDYAGRYHLALDLMTDLGTEIYAIEDGLIVKSEDGQNYQGYKTEEEKNNVPPEFLGGGALIVEHTSYNGSRKWYSLYGHINNRSRSVGTYVKKGDYLGRVSWSLYRANAHLHFGINTSNQYLSGKYWQGYTSIQSVTQGFVDPRTFFSEYIQSDFRVSVESIHTSPTPDMKYLNKVGYSSEIIMQGMGQNENLKREEAWIMIFRAMKYALNKELDNNALSRITNQSDPSRFITRQELLVMLIRVLDYAGFSYDVQNIPVPFPDIPLDDLYRQAIVKAFNTQIVDRDTTYIYPQNPVPRFRFAEWLRKTVNLIKWGKLRVAHPVDCDEDWVIDKDEITLVAIDWILGLGIFGISDVHSALMIWKYGANGKYTVDEKGKYQYQKHSFKIINHDRNSPSIAFNSTGESISRDISSIQFNSPSPVFLQVNAKSLFILEIEERLPEGWILVNDSISDKGFYDSDNHRIFWRFFDLQGNISFENKILSYQINSNNHTSGLFAAVSRYATLEEGEELQEIRLPDEYWHLEPQITSTFTPTPIHTPTATPTHTSTNIPTAIPTLVLTNTPTPSSPSESIPIFDDSGLKAINNRTNAHYILMNDIDLSQTSWIPLCRSTPFSGLLDGNGYTIRNLNIDKPTGSLIGLFAWVSGGHIRNLNIENCIISGHDEVGSIAGQIDHRSFIINCSSSGIVKSDNVAGGLAGRIDFESEIIDSHYNGIVESEYNAGGLVGSGGSKSSISNCSSNGSVTAKKTAGGLLGGADSSFKAKNSFSFASVSGIENIGGLIGFNQGVVEYCNTFGDIHGGIHVGGLIGNNSDNAKVKCCSSFGTVTGHELPNTARPERVGGLIGWNRGSVESCYSQSDVSGWRSVGGLIGHKETGDLLTSYSTGNVNGSIYVGGLVGFNVDPIANCYSISRIVADDSYSGGLIGSNYSVVEDCYSTGKMEGNATLSGGLVGSSQFEMPNCFWDIDTSGQTSSNKGTGLNTLNMKQGRSYTDANWNFLDYWDLSESINDGYPYLLPLQRSYRELIQLIEMEREPILDSFTLVNTPNRIGCLPYEIRLSPPAHFNKDTIHTSNGRWMVYMGLVETHEHQIVSNIQVEWNMSVDSSSIGNSIHLYSDVKEGKRQWLVISWGYVNSDFPLSPHTVHIRIKVNTGTTLKYYRQVNIINDDPASEVESWHMY